MQIKSDEATQIPWVNKIQKGKKKYPPWELQWEGISRCFAQKFPLVEQSGVSLRDFRATNVNNCDWKMNYLRSDI